MSTPSHPSSVWGLVILGLLLACGTIYAWHGQQDVGVGLLYAAILPPILLLSLLRYDHSADLPLGIVIEQFALGCTLSIGLATILEGFGQLESLPIWKAFELGGFQPICDLIFVPLLIVTIGLSEEAAKFFPIVRFTRTRRHLPRIGWERWFRLIETPRGVVIAGCASAAGFACIENVKYVVSTSREEGVISGIWTSVLRGFLAIPLHLACTGIAAAYVAERWFFDPQSYMLVHRSAYSVISLEEPLSTPIMDSRESWTRNEFSRFEYEEIAYGVEGPTSLWKGALQPLWLPSVLHGLYDSGLFIIAQLGGSKDQALIGRSTGGHHNHAELRDEIVVSGALYVSALSYVAIIVIFIYRWHAIGKLQCNALPRLHHLLDVTTL